MNLWPCGKSKDNWFPLEDAPKDSTRVVLYRHGFGEDHAICYWNSEFDCWMIAGSNYSQFVFDEGDTVLYAEIPY